jgi:hypothetical protein
MAAARARSSRDPSESVGEEPASLVSMRRSLDGVMVDITNHSISTRSCFLNIWRRLVRVIDDHLQDEVEKESFFVTDEEDELDVEPPRDKIHKKKDKKDKEKKSKKVKRDPSRSPAESEDPDPPLNKKSRPGRLQHDDDIETKDALVRTQVPTASAPSESAKAVPPPPAACSAKAIPRPPAAPSLRLAPMPPPPPPPARRVPKVVPPCPKMRPSVAKMQCGS